MKLEVNEKIVDETPILKGGSHYIMMTPALGEDYWAFKVKLYRNQALLAFPKFGTIGIGFAQEEDWNTNLPYTSPTEKIYNHIKHNKKYKQITKAQCIKAIKMLQKVAKEFKE